MAILISVDSDNEKGGMAILSVKLSTVITKKEVWLY